MRADERGNGMLAADGCSCYSNIRRRGAAERQAKGRTLLCLRWMCDADPGAAATGEEWAVADRYSVLSWGVSLAAACGNMTAGCAQGDERGAADTRVPSIPSGMKAPPGTGGIMPAPGDAEAAVRSEFAGIERMGTAEAYALFAERHPDHPLGHEAARRAASLGSGPSASPIGS